MKAPILKRVAHWARHDLASKNVHLGSGQVHQLIAAMLGFNTHAAFAQSSALDTAVLAAPAVVELDTKRGLARCQALDASLPARLVVNRLTHILESANTHELVFAGGHHATTSALFRHVILSQPRMSGVADNNRSLQGTGSLITFPNGHCRIRASGEYVDAHGESGSVDLDAMFEHQAGPVFALERLTVDFRPGEFDELVMDEFTGYDHG